jgi:hypothetical protein
MGLLRSRDRVTPMSELNRRQAIAGLGTISLGAVLAACGEDEAPRRSSATTDLFGDSSACTLTPEQTEGPYYFDVDSVRSDIREDRSRRSIPAGTGAARSISTPRCTLTTRPC